MKSSEEYPGGAERMCVCVRWLACLGVLCCAMAAPPAVPKAPEKRSELWILKPVVRLEIPAGVSQSPNPIDAFIAAQYKAKRVRPVGPADKSTLLRRVYLDLIGIPPTPSE